MATPPEDYSWSPLFDVLEAPSEPQTCAMPITIEATMSPSEGLPAPPEPSDVKVPTIAPHRKTEALTDTFWVLREVVQGGIVLRDGPENRWFEEAFWVPGSDLGRSYAIVFEGLEYEFAGRVALRNAKRQVYADPEAQQPPAEAA